MPVIWHEPKKRLGTAWDRSRSRIPPKPVWPGLDHNGRPIEDDDDDDANTITTEPAASAPPATEATAAAAAAASTSAAAEIVEAPSNDVPTANTNTDTTTTTATATAVPPLRPRSRKRKKPVPAVWKEIMNEEGGNNQIMKGLPSPSDLQVEQEEEEAKKRRLAGGVPATGGCEQQLARQPSEEGASPSHPTAAPPVEIESQSSSDLLSYLPTMAKGITHIQSMLGKLVASSGASENDGATTAAVATSTSTSTTSSRSTGESNHHQSMEALLSRMEYVASRQEAGHFKLLEDKEQRIKELETRIQSLESSRKEQENGVLLQKQHYAKKTLSLQDEATQRDNVITELQRSQEQERKESQNRVTEALQKIEQLQDLNEKLSRRNEKLKAVKDNYDKDRAALRGSSNNSDNPQHSHLTSFLARKNINNAMESSSSATDRVKAMKRKKRSSSFNAVAAKQHGSDSSLDSFGTPKSRDSWNGHHSDDSPFSSGSVGSTKAVSHRGNNKRSSIIPGNTIAQGGRPKEDYRAPKANRRFTVKTNIRDLIPNYALDSLARGKSNSS